VKIKIKRKSNSFERLLRENTGKIGTATIFSIN